MEISITPEAKEAADSVKTLASVAAHTVVNSQEQFTAAEHNLAAIKAKKKELIDLRLSITRPIDASKKKIMEFFSMPVTALEGAERLIRGHLSDYLDEQEKRAKAKQAELDEKARKEKEKLEKRAEQAEQSGKAEKAEHLRDQAETTQAVTVAPAVQTSKTTKRKTWSAEVTDVKALLQAVIDEKVPASVVSVNMVVLNKMAVALKSELNYPGVNAIESTSIVSKR